jgi:hypothetical protein
MKPSNDKWELFTPTYDYIKEPYWVRQEGEIILCYPYGGLMHEMGGRCRYFHPCYCEVQLAGWEEDIYHPMHRSRPK